MIDDGKKELEVAEEVFGTWARNWKALSRYRQLKAQARDFATEIITLVGPTGCGKTRSVYEQYPDVYSVPQKKGSGTYWDGYEGQETVLVDEMYGSRFSLGFLLQLTDRYPFQVPVHGGSVNFCSKRIVFTSNAHPKDWYRYQATGGFSGSPLERRLTTNGSKIVLFDGWDKQAEKTDDAAARDLSDDVVAQAVADGFQNPRLYSGYRFDD